ncbi:hypothetical protein RBU49_06630 [Clostridium sp. MB40-C1]|uniref:hypothetical protein n=1 Tax=Clostridium sp. MB40-C1 TaxID=3070996 RepID=UPI0027DFC656|nr:hypothetical protein [Clostridium sp. MB40-C1]WMJ81917.1 hypothetical protein RBU49_06630 [Clostridium sp. MB40-C1]
MKISFFYKCRDGYVISNESNNTEEVENNKNKTIKKIAEHIERKCEEYKDEIDFNKDSEELEQLLKAFKEEIRNTNKEESEDNDE